MSIQDHLSNELNRLENYGPAKDYYKLFKEAPTYFDKLNVIKQYYQDNEKNILSVAIKSIHKSYDINAFEWMHIFSPIEKIAWGYIRCAGIILYPQYPALYYTLDFCNPYLKIALETDGKDYHDYETDIIRDQRIYDKLGIKIFRVNGSECMKDMDQPNRYPDKYDDEGCHALAEYMFYTVDGVIEAIKQVYFTPKKQMDQEEKRFYNICIDTLTDHKIANFNIL